MRTAFPIAGILVLLIAISPICGADVPAMPSNASIPQPLIPHSFYGNVTAAGSPVPAGVPVEAVAEGIKKGVPGNPIYSIEGGYGSHDPYAPRLEVQGTMDPGTEIFFYVGGTQAEVRLAGTDDEWKTSFPYSPGSVTNLDLRVPNPVTPDPGYRITQQETISPSLSASPQNNMPNPSQNFMIGLIAILVILGVIAFFLGRRSEKEKEEVSEEKSDEDQNNESSKAGQKEE
jgi:hypothetical protein